MNQNEMLAVIAKMDNEAQNNFYNELRNNGFTENDVLVIQEAVFTYKLFMEEGFNQAIKKSMAETLYKEFTGKELNI